MTSEMDKAMKKMKDMGVTINVIPAFGDDDGFKDRPSGIIAEAAKRAGIYYEKGN